MWAATYWQLVIVPTCCILTGRRVGKLASLGDDRQQMCPKMKMFSESVFRAYGLVCVCVCGWIDGYRVYTLCYVCVLLSLYSCTTRTEVQV